MYFTLPPPLCKSDNSEVDPSTEVVAVPETPTPQVNTPSHLDPIHLVLEGTSHVTTVPRTWYLGWKDSNLVSSVGEVLRVPVRRVYVSDYRRNPRDLSRSRRHCRVFLGFREEEEGGDEKWKRGREEIQTRVSEDPLLTDTTRTQDSCLGPRVHRRRRASCRVRSLASYL